MWRFSGVPHSRRVGDTVLMVDSLVKFNTDGELVEAASKRLRSIGRPTSPLLWQLGLQ